MSGLGGSERANDSLRSHSLSLILIMVVEGQAFRRKAACGARWQSWLGLGDGLLGDIY